MRTSVLTRITLAASVVLLSSGAVAYAQSTTDKPMSDKSKAPATDKSTTMPSRSMSTPSPADTAAGRHMMDGRVTKVDPKKGWIDVKTDEGSMKLHFPQDDGRKTDLGTKAAEGAGVGAVSGGGLGALLAGLAAAGVAVPGLPIIAMGPLAAAVTGAGTGGALGALIGGLIGYGIPEERARMYERGIRDGGIVMGVTPRTPDDV